MKKSIILVLLTLMISACATAYQKKVFTGGYSDIRLDKNIFKVSFKGNGYVSKERASDFALLRSAELTLENGYRYFIITTMDSYVELSIGFFTEKTTSRPSANNIIVSFKEKPKVNGISYNATFVEKSIKEKYKIK